MPDKPKSKQYYDIHDLKRYLSINYIRDLFFKDEYHHNGEMVTFYNPDEFDEEYADRNSVQYKNRLKVFEEFGEIEVKVWW